MNRLINLITGLSVLAGAGCATIPERQASSESFFICESYVDYNLDNKVQRNEFLKKGNKEYSVQKPITFAGSIFGKEGDRFSIGVFSLSGEKVFGESKIINQNKFNYIRELRGHDLVGRGGRGEYVAEFYIGEELVGFERFKIR